MLDLSFPLSHQMTFRFQVFLVFPQMTAVICCHLGAEKGSIKSPFVYNIFLSPHLQMTVSRRTRETHADTDKDKEVCLMSVSSRDL
jgi:hypothetical protein